MKKTIAMRSLAAIIPGLASSLSSADTTTIYKSIDSNGTTIFTDQEAPDATIITPSPLNIADPLPAAAPRQSSFSTPPSPDAIVSSVTISSPSNQQVLIGQQSELWVEFELAPAKTLPPDLSALLLMDGSVTSSGQSNRLPVSISERGTHTLQVQLIDLDGKVQTESNIIQVHVRQTTVGGAK